MASIFVQKKCFHCGKEKPVDRWAFYPDNENVLL